VVYYGRAQFLKALSLQSVRKGFAVPLAAARQRIIVTTCI
jgi:hypothetical protein